MARIAGGWLIVVSAEVDERFLIRVTGKACGRSRFVGDDRRLNPWRSYALQFEDRATARACLKTLVFEPGQKAKVVRWRHAYRAVRPLDYWKKLPQIDVAPAGGD